MELSINKIGFKTPVNQVKPLTINKQNYTTNNISTTLPNFSQSAGLIPFGNALQSYTNEDFLLPSNCVPDIYQIEAANALKRGDNTIVTAPTGTGKTAIAYYIINKNMKEGKRTFYTTPLKALSNQKYSDLKKIFGDENVGILTGDRKENAHAPIVIMTTEIYRNMVTSNYFARRTPQLDNLETVIFDEFHYMGDPNRGNFWEESIMYTPKQTQILALSATVGNNEKITSWIKDKKLQQTTLVNVPITNRHVPLEFSIINPTVEDSDDTTQNSKHVNKKNSKNPTNVISVLEDLENENKLPAIVFVFSKLQIENLLDTAADIGRDLTTKEEKQQIKDILQKYINTQNFYSTSLDLEALYKGYATHSAAILPIQKQLIEELFNKKLIKVVFATETLSAGINMPARTVVMTDCEKPSSASNLSSESFMRPLMSNEFHQMSGRAGRRGIDNIGYVVMLADTREKKNIFKSLIKSAPNNITSNYKIDASNVTEFYNITTCREWFKHILDKSFSLYNLSEPEYEAKFNAHMKDFDDYSELLSMYKYLVPAKDGYSTTEKGQLINKIKGRPQIPILESIFKKHFNNVTPETLAGLLAAIAVPPTSIEKINAVEECEQKIDKQTLKSLNIEIDKVISEKLKLSLDKISSKSSNDDILNFVEHRFRSLLGDNISDLIKRQSEIEREINNNIKRSEEDWTEDLARDLANLYSEQVKVKRSILISKEYKVLKSLLAERLSLMLMHPNEENKVLDSTDYNNIQKTYDKYNYDLSTLGNENISPAVLNHTALTFVNKWAELNAQSDDYGENWDTICKMLKSKGSIKFEGDLFNAIAQTIDFIHQFESIIRELATRSTKEENIQTYKDLAQKCQLAESLLRRPPLYNDNM